MRRVLSLFFFVAIVLLNSAVAHAESSSAAPSDLGGAAMGRGGFSDLANKLLPAVVNISTEQTIESSDNDSDGGAIFGFPKGFFEGFFNNMEPLLIDPPKPRKVVSLGSGFIVDKSGLIVTNYHVIANAQDIQVKFSDNTTAKATVLGQDPKTDLAVLKVHVQKDLQSVKLGNSDDAMVGEWVLAIGNPFGLGGSVSVGIISGRARDINIGTSGEFLQTDAAINRGHSGGPLFNAMGEVIGVNTAIISPQGGGNVGVAFAIPSNNASRIINVLSKGEKVEHGWLGVVVQRVTENMVGPLGLDTARGALISTIVKDSPAEKGGLKVGDVILEFHGKKIDDMPQLTNLIAKTAVNEKVRVVVLRDGQQVSLKVVIGRLSDEASGALHGGSGSESSYESLGFVVGNLPKDLSKKHEGGVVVLKVDSRSDAYVEGVRRGDILVGIDSMAIGSVADFNKALEKVQQNVKKSSVLLLIQKGDAPPIYIPVKVRR
ncbi:Do family serine endopeptidase [Candidatus Anaplasma sp. TIGMIC]|uniref:Do family serine endopeptidase n=1 Tax=Candidatus Anaplasma sp. TIGMIC TaxID=3020713 RepID=UPI00232AD3A3|nr:Do family serine endopeptidase [Candidatus Anaplasma sp. TIGMIC]MDB1135736.1 Do family serine endopeptidase [Candidatus Anaplasma sp. TIGMIC]